MKELHLICNAHLDPVWQWDYEEGITSAIATFYSAAELAEQYDYIFCHNEAFLYEVVEKYDNVLFKRIQELVKKGKWHIMGGWYVQPDCNLPSGEGFIRQIETGRKYFKEKFNANPKVAINFDSFGHTQGLVQILKKCGYDGYLFCRPMPANEGLKLPDMAFTWEGFDGSKIKAVRSEDETIYLSFLGKAVDDIKRKMQPWKDREVAIALWGVGNHGGGASRKDLSDIEQFKIESSDNITVIHSTPEAFFDKLSDDLPVFSKSLQPIFVKCYSSLAKLKQRYCELENELFKTEKICTIANLNGLCDYNYKAFEEAQKCLSLVQFHDVLSGTCIEDNETQSLRKIEYALELLTKEFDKAFLSLAQNYTKGAEGEFPIFVFNPNPYEIDDVFECEIFMLDALWQGEEGYEIHIKKDGIEQQIQTIKERSNINFDRRKRFAVRSKLLPFGLTRFDISFEVKNRFRLDRTPQYEFDNGKVSCEFDKQNGLLMSLKKDGKEYLSGGIIPISYDDNADPWGWGMIEVGTNYCQLKPTTTNRIVERGQVFTAIESGYTTGKSDVYLTYKFYKDLPYIDLNVVASWNDEGKGLKLQIPVKEILEFVGQTAFGLQEYEINREQCSQKYCAVRCNDKYLTVLNESVKACEVVGNNLFINLFNASVYCAHPVNDFPIIDDNRHNSYVEIGKHYYSFRLYICELEEAEKFAAEFINKPYSLNVYPHNKENVAVKDIIDISSRKINLVSFRRINNKEIMIRLHNNSKKPTSCDIRVMDCNLSLSFGKFEVKTLIYDGSLYENDLMLKL